MFCVCFFWEKKPFEFVFVLFCCFFWGGEGTQKKKCPLTPSPRLSSGWLSRCEILGPTEKILRTPLLPVIAHVPLLILILILLLIIILKYTFFTLNRTVCNDNLFISIEFLSRVLFIPQIVAKTSVKAALVRKLWKATTVTAQVGFKEDTAMNVQVIHHRHHRPTRETMQ